MTEANKVFRQAVLDRLASPEQLNSLMQVTNAQGWLALTGCAVLLAVALVWGFLGRVPTKVEASGILLYGGGLADVVALGQGQISALEVEVGDVVSSGEVIAEVAQPDLAEQIKGAKSRLTELKSNWERAKVRGARRQPAAARRGRRAHEPRGRRRGGRFADPRATRSSRLAAAPLRQGVGDEGGHRVDP